MRLTKEQIETRRNDPNWTDVPDQQDFIDTIDALEKRELQFAAMIQEMLDAVDSCTDVPQQLIDAFQKIADQGKGALERHDADLTRLARAQGIREAGDNLTWDSSKITNQSWREGYDAAMNDAKMLVSKCLDRDAQEALAEHDRQVREKSYAEGFADGSKQTQSSL